MSQREASQNPPLAGGIPFALGDYVAVVNYSNQTSAADFEGNVLYDDGSVTTYRVAAVNNNSRAGILSKGALLGRNGRIMSAFMHGSTTQGIGAVPAQPGALYAKAYLVRGGSPISLICQGYVSVNDALLGTASTNGPCYPPGPTAGNDMVAGPGMIYDAEPTPPIAGADISFTVPANARWKIRGLTFQLVTSTAVANRQVSLQINDPNGDFVYQVEAGGTTPLSQTASLTWTYIFTAGYMIQETAIDGNLTIRIPMPLDLVLPTGYQIKTSTKLISAADQWIISTVQVEEWISA